MAPREARTPGSEGGTNHQGATHTGTARLGTGPPVKGTAVHVPPIPHLTDTDPTLADLIEREASRQHDVLRMIPSENYVSAAVLEATGTLLTNKYSEGYAGKRYYEGQQLIDPIERLAVQRAQDLFGVDHANVQPYSGSPANLAIYLAYMTAGDTFLSLELAHGGLLTASSAGRGRPSFRHVALLIQVILDQGPQQCPGLAGLGGLPREDRAGVPVPVRRRGLEGDEQLPRVDQVRASRPRGASR